jgi:hypothetical protein
MTLKSIPAAIAIALLSVGGSALAAGGNVTTASLSPGAVFPGESINLKVGVTQGSFGTDCKIRWSLKDAANVEVKGGTHRMVSNANSADYSVGFGAPGPGQYKLDVMGGPPDSQTTSCGGSATAAVTVKDKSAISAVPAAMNLGVAPRPATTQVVVQMPSTIAQLATTTLTAIKQVAFTNNSGETWIEAQGTGNCSFTIESAGVAPASFSSSAAKPFPLKVKIAGAPLGSHTWKAQGTGNCSGTASATFSVN